MASLGPLFRHVQDHENTCVLEVKTDSEADIEFFNAFKSII